MPTEREQVQALKLFLWRRVAALTEFLHHKHSHEDFRWLRSRYETIIGKLLHVQWQVSHAQHGRERPAEHAQLVRTLHAALNEKKRLDGRFEDAVNAYCKMHHADRCPHTYCEQGIHRGWFNRKPVTVCTRHRHVDSRIGLTGRDYERLHHAHVTSGQPKRPEPYDEHPIR